MLAYYVRPDQILTRTEYFVTVPDLPPIREGRATPLTSSDAGARSDKEMAHTPLCIALRDSGVEFRLSDTTK